MNTTIRNAVGERLDYTFIEGTGSRQDSWIVVLGHGVTGNKDRAVIADTAAALTDAGFDTLRFSFAGNGESEGDFRECTISKEVGDLGAVLDEVAKHYRRIAYVGHSMGAAVGVLVAAQDARLSALISLAGMVDTKAFAEAEFGGETPDKGTMWEQEDCPLSSTFMTDLCDTISDVSDAAEKITIPWLLIHGTMDDVVLPRDTQKIQKIKGVGVEALFVDGADHSFNEPDHKKQMVNKVFAWMTGWL